MVNYCNQELHFLDLAKSIYLIYVRRLTLLIAIASTGRIHFLGFYLISLLYNPFVWITCANVVRLTNTNEGILTSICHGNSEYEYPPKNGKDLNKSTKKVGNIYNSIIIPPP